MNNLRTIHAKGAAIKKHVKLFHLHYKKIVLPLELHLAMLSLVISTLLYRNQI
jgi:hypothetical protein